MKRLYIILFALATLIAQAQNLPYITKVYDFLPAPSQFVNSLPKCNIGDTKATVLARVEEKICGKMEIEENELPDGTIVNDTTIKVSSGEISLGSYGGYVVFGFDHPVVNVKGEYDLQIFGNAFQSNESTMPGGSSEPGIVMVSRDANDNGIPDDPWYELAGSEYNNPKTQKHFTITYYKPDDNKPAVPSPNDPTITDAEYIRWTCNSVDSLQEGYVFKNAFHSQSYWPLWEDSVTLTFTGTKLACNGEDIGKNGRVYWFQHCYDWGYVDNRPDAHYGYGIDKTGVDLNKGFNIEWAVDDEGNPVDLKQIDFVKVYCGVLQYCGQLGETSTEVAGAIDLHPDAVAEIEVIAGDVNGDGVCNAADVTALYNWILNNDDSALVNGDQNNDDIINAGDVTTVYNIILGN